MTSRTDPDLGAVVHMHLVGCWRHSWGGTNPRRLDSLEKFVSFFHKPTAPHGCMPRQWALSQCRPARQSTYLLISMHVVAPSLRLSTAPFWLG